MHYCLDDTIPPIADAPPEDRVHDNTCGALFYAANPTITPFRGCVQLQCGSIIRRRSKCMHRLHTIQMIMIKTFPVQLDPFLVVCADESKVISSCFSVCAHGNSAHI
eukprot:884535_1